jgi:hypothetical protein
VCIALDWTRYALRTARSLKKVKIHEVASHRARLSLRTAGRAGLAFDPPGNLWIAHANTVSNNVEIDQFDSTGLLAGGFYLHTDEGPLGAGVYSDFYFRPSATAAAPEPATWSMMMIGFGLFAAASRRNARQRRR